MGILRPDQSGATFGKQFGKNIPLRRHAAIERLEQRQLLSAAIVASAANATAARHFQLYAVHQMVNAKSSAPTGTISAVGAISPNVTSISPAIGSPAGGTSVTITGTNFTGATAVKFGNANATNVKVVSATSITATSPAGAMGVADVVVTTPSGTSPIVAGDKFTFDAAPTVAMAASGPLLPIKATSTSLSVFGADDGGEANLAYTWATTGNPPAAVAFSPNSTNAAQNTTATFTKAGVYNIQVTLTDASGLTATSALNVTVLQSATSISGNPSSLIMNVGATQQFTATVKDQFNNAFSPQPALTWMVTGGGTVSNTGLFTATIAGGPFDISAAFGGISAFTDITVAAGTAPTVTSISPSTGPLAGGTVVTVTGTNFAAPMDVVFGSFGGTNIVVNSPTSITATAPAEAAGVVDVQVATIALKRTATSAADHFTFAPAVGSPPTVATAASATPNPVANTTTVLSVLGADAAGEPSLAYTWATTGSPPAPVVFSINGNNAAKNTTATFTKIGVYNFQVTIADAGGLKVTSAVTVTVNATATYNISPVGAVIKVGATQQYTATVTDQFNNLIVPQPAFTWFVTGGGTVSNTGLFTATTIGGPFEIDANTSTTGIGTPLSVIAGATAPTVATPASATPSPVTAKTTALSVLGADAAGEPSLTYTWATTGSPPAPVVFSANTSNAAKNTTATFTKVGVYNFQVTITNGAGLKTTSMVVVTVNPTLAAIQMNPASVIFNIGETQQFTATGFDQFNNVLAIQPAYTWTVAGGGTVSNTGLFTATTAGGPFMIKATFGLDTAVTDVTVLAGTAPAVASVSPASGPIAGGTVVTITGVNFAAPMGVLFGSFGAANIKVNSATSITATAPAEAAGIVDVVVTTLAGKRSAAIAADQFTYTAPVGATPPTVAVAASATPNPTTVATTNLSVLGADAAGEPSLTYMWATTGSPPAPVVFSANGTNAAKNSSVIFSKAGVYNFQVTITDPSALTTTSSVTVTVNIGMFIHITPVSSLINVGATEQYSAAYYDQFNNFLPQPAIVTWSVTGGGTISNTGLFTATTAGGPFQVIAIAGGNTGSTNMTVDAGTAPTVTSVTPATGTIAGGTTVTITGTNLGTIVGVLFGNVNASNVKVNSPTSITATAPAQAAGVVDVRVVFPSASLSATSAADLFTYTAVAASPPTVATPASATPSPVLAKTTALSVLGADAVGEPSLNYTWAATGSPPAPVVFSANNSNAAKNTIATFTKAGVYNFKVTITNPSSLSVTSMVMVTVNATLTTITVAPPGAALTVAGTKQFAATALDQFGVALAVQPAFTWMASGGGTINAAGLFTATTVGGPFTVTATSGLTSGTAAVTVGVAAGMPPTVTSLLPTNGPLAGGTVVTITGTNFLGATAVMFGGVAGTNLTVNSATSITVTSPAGAAGAVDVTVVTVGGTSAINAGDKFTFNAVALPTVTVVSPASGPLFGGNTVTITGTNFTGATEVDFGTIMDFNFAVISATDITVQAPTGPAGVVDVKVITPAGTSATSAADRYTFSAPAGPSVTTPASATPNPVTGKTTVLSVLGADPAGQPSLIYTWATIGGVPAPVLFSANGSNAAKNTTATFSQAGVYDFLVTITDPSSLSITSAVMVTANATLTSIIVAPANAPVMVTGTQQFSATAFDQFGVTLTVQPAIVWTVNGGGIVDNSGLFTATSAGGPFVVTATSGIVKGTAAVAVQPPPPPSVTGVSPAIASLAGGELVTITGSNFTGATKVAFGAVDATDVTVISATLITASAPAEATAAVDVTVTTPAGTSTKNPADLFTFDDAPTAETTATFTPNADMRSGVLSVLGASDGGEANLTYSWAATGIAASPVFFSGNDDNAARNTTVTFTRAGVYDFQVTITDVSGLATTSAVSVTIAPTLAAIEATPSITTIGIDQTQQFIATGLDQFGVVLGSQPTFTWSANGGGSISAAGLFSASAIGGPFTFTASSGTISGTASATVVGPTFLGQITSTTKLQKFSATLADGAELTVKLHFGSVIISQFNNELYLAVTGTTDRSTLVVGGSITFASISVSGPLQTFQALNGDIAGGMSVDGSINKLQVRTITGTFASTGSINVAKIGDVSGTLATTGAMKRVTIGAVNGALILSGANLGPDGLFGGGDDKFSAGSIGLVSIESPVVNSRIEAGVNPGADGVFGTADDSLSGGGSIARIILLGTPDSISRFEAGQFGVVRMPVLKVGAVPSRLRNPLLDTDFVIPK